VKVAIENTDAALTPSISQETAAGTAGLASVTRLRLEARSSPVPEPAGTEQHERSGQEHTRVGRLGDDREVDDQLRQE
jgi:hypothetical protein